MKIRLAIVVTILMFASSSILAGTLFVGLEGSAPPTQTSDLTGFPDVSWTPGFSIDVSAAAATPEGEVYICNGSFTSHLYKADMNGHAPQFLSTVGVDVSGLAYGRDTLYAYSNFASPKGIYAIEPTTGAATLVLDVYSGPGFRFFALDYNPVDDLLYGYTEYGDTGLYSLNIDTGEMIKIVTPIPASNSSARAMAVGNNTVYLLATRGDDGVDGYAYDLGQGLDGNWVAFTNPYPQFHSTGGAAFIRDPLSGSGHSSFTPEAPARLQAAQPNPFNPQTAIHYELFKDTSVNLGIFDVAGHLVRTLRDNVPESAGPATVIWNGRDNAGRSVPSGTYLYQLKVDGYSATERMTLVR